MPYSFLHIAALRNDCDSATAYLEGGGEDKVHVWESQERGQNTIEPIDVDVRDDQGWTPLMCAATHGHLEMCDLLFEFGADVNARKNFSVAPLHLASRNGHRDVIEFLLLNNADITMEKVDLGIPLHDAAFGGHLDCAQFLLRHAAQNNNLEASSHLSKALDDGSTPLHVASRRGHAELVSFFIGEGAPVTAKDESARQPHEVAKNRKTLIAFPSAADPVHLQTFEVGAMGRDHLEYTGAARRRGNLDSSNSMHHMASMSSGCGARPTARTRPLFRLVTACLERATRWHGDAHAST